MITQKEFLEIVEKHLKMREDGSIYIEDSVLASKFTEYLKQFAVDENKTDRFHINVACISAG